VQPRRSIPDELLRLAGLQDGVLTLEQAGAFGVTPTVVKRLCAQQHWQRLGRGLLFVRPGSPPWRAWAWAGVLAAGDRARLGPEASGHLWGLRPEPPELVDVLCPISGRPTLRGPWVFRRERPGVRSEHSVGSPPRLTAVDTLLDLCALSSSGEVVDLVTRAARLRAVRPEELLLALQRRRLHPCRRLLTELLQDVAEGRESPLELRYLRDVERAHGLPVGRRNRYRGGLRHRSDVGYDDYGVLVELDGRLGHAEDGRFRDFRRDNDFAVRSLVTLRYGWYDVTERSCEVAQQVGTVVASRGWTDLIQRCPRCRRVVW
jgi:hypothetical protein